MILTLWKGHHAADLPERIRQAWESADRLMILCPPALVDYGFVRVLRQHFQISAMESAGQWSAEEETAVKKAFDSVPVSVRVPRDEAPYASSAPVLGVFTSGTATGRPRLVLYSRENVEASLRAVRSLFDVTRIKKIFCYPQPTHTFGLTLGYLQAQLFGAELVAPLGPYSRASHQWWLQEAGAGTLTLGVPTHFHDLIGCVRATGRPPPATYSCIAGGARVSAGLWSDLRGILRIEQPSIGYGATECAPGVTHLGPGSAPSENGEIGSALPGVEITLSAGGLEVRGPNVALALLDWSSEGGRLSWPDGRVHLPDILRPRAGGGLVYEGRASAVLNRGGIKYALEPMEEMLAQKLGLQAVCVAVPEERLGEELGVLVVNSGRCRREEVFRVLYQTYGVAFSPLWYAATGGFPLNPSRKLDRQACREQLFRLRDGLR